MKTGDKVRIVDYGHLIWSREPMELPIYGTSNNGKIKWYDLAPHLVGKETIITGVTETQGKKRYRTDLFSWASEKQLEKI